ncbi:MAG: flavin reductase family protein [Pseudomonadota bacterium]
MSFDSRDFRNALGRFATGVCVITGETPSGDAFGMTVNSFASVSLEPPLVLWSLQNNSEMYETFEHCTRWAVNILRLDQQELSNRYAKKGDHSLAPEHLEQGACDMPVLADSLVSLECELEARYPGGDHVILVARVLGMTERETADPLVFCNGGYAALAG